MKCSRFLACLLSLVMVFSVMACISAFAEEDADDVMTTLSDEDLEALMSTLTAEDTPEEPTTPATTAALAGFDAKKVVKYSVSDPRISFKLPVEFKCITVDSGEEELSNFGTSLREFISYGYIAYAVSDENTSYLYITQSSDDYTTKIKDYKKLSSEELRSLAKAKASEYDSATYTLMYDSVDVVNLNGRNYLKGVSSSSTNVTDVIVNEYTTVAGGREYVITAVYPVGMDEKDVKTFIDSIETIKINSKFGGIDFSSDIDSNSLISYIALALSAAALAAALYSIFKKKSPAKEITAYDYSEPYDKPYFGVENNGEAFADDARNASESFADRIEDAGEDISNQFDGAAADVSDAINSVVDDVDDTIQEAVSDDK